jgi:hypothetical protein
MILHVFILFAKELNVGLRIFAGKGEGDKEVMVVFVSGFEKHSEKGEEARSVFGSNLDFECIGADGAMFERFAFQVSPGEVHLREGETSVDVVEFGKFLGKIVNVFKREFVEGVLSKFANFVADTVRAVKEGLAWRIHPGEETSIRLKPRKCWRRKTLCLVGRFEMDLLRMENDLSKQRILTRA